MRRVTFSNADIEKRFKGGIGEELDAEAIALPNAPMVDLYVADPLVPSVGRTLMGEEAYEKLLSDLPDGQPAILVISAGRWSVQGEQWTPGSVPDRLIIKQSGLPIVVRDMTWSKPLLADGVPSQEMMILKIPATAGFDPASAFDVVPHITRAKGQFMPELISVEPVKSVQWPRDFYIIDKTEAAVDGWRAIWVTRWFDLAVISAALALLTLALTFQKQTVSHRSAFLMFRMAFLGFTLVFIGWYAQAQLSVVTLAGLVKAAVYTNDFFLSVVGPAFVVVVGLYDGHTGVLGAWRFLWLVVPLWRNPGICRRDVALTAHSPVARAGCGRQIVAATQVSDFGRCFAGGILSIVFVRKIG